MNKTITKRVKVNGVLTDADSLPLMRDADNTFGVRRVDTLEVVVAAGEAFAATDADGIYVFPMTDLVAGVLYQYAVEVVVNGVTHRQVETFTLADDVTLEDPPTDDELVGQIRTNLASPASAAADGQSASQHNLKDQIAAADWLSRRQAAARGPVGGMKILKIKGPGME